MFCLIDISNSMFLLWNGTCIFILFCIKSGARLDGINYPIFFNVYVNGLLLKLRSSGADYYLCFDFVGCLFFIDDIANCYFHVR